MGGTRQDLTGDPSPHILFEHSAVYINCKIIVDIFCLKMRMQQPLDAERTHKQTVGDMCDKHCVFADGALLEHTETVHMSTIYC